MSKSVIGGKIHCCRGARAEGADEREEDGGVCEGRGWELLSGEKEDLRGFAWGDSGGEVETGTEAPSSGTAPSLSAGREIDAKGWTEAALSLSPRKEIDSEGWAEADQVSPASEAAGS
jgi:hypothetical protein